LRVADQDDQVAGPDQVGGRTVDPDHAGATLALDDVRLQPVSVGDVQDVHQLARQQVGGVHQLRVHRDGTDVVEVRLGDGGTVDLRLEHGAQHDARTPR